MPFYREACPETIEAFERAGTGIGVWAKGKPAPVSWHSALCDNTIALHDLGIIYRHVRGCLYAPREVAQA